MKLNMKLLPIKAHYFLIFAGTAPMLPFLPVYIRQQGISAAGISLIYTALPFAGLLAKTVSGVLSDYLRVHRVVFLTSILVCALGFFSIYFCPPMPQKPDPKPAHLTLTCDLTSTSLTFCSPRKKCAQAEYLENLPQEYIVACEMQCQPLHVQGGGGKEEKEEEEGDMLNLCTVFGLPACSPNQPLNLSVEADIALYSKKQHCTSFPVYNVSIDGVQVTESTCTNTTTSCTVTCPDASLMTFLGAPPTTPPTSYEEVLQHAPFWLHLVCMIVAWCGLAVTVVMSDTICFQLLGAAGHKYGKQRLFGSLGWGTLVVVTGGLIDYASGTNTMKDYTPAFILSLAILFIDLLAATRLEVEGREKEVGVAGGAVMRLVCEPRLVLFILCCVVVGVSTGILWTYQLMLVEDIAFAWDCNFTRLKLLQGLIMGVQCFGGELPFFFLSGWFIRKLKHTGAMSLVIAVFGLRYVLYYAISNPWWFLPVELLNGFTFGIFYATMTSYASEVAPPGSQATLQGIVGAAFEGVGVALGGFVGGALFFTVGGSRTFLYTGIFNAVFAALHIILQLMLNSCTTQHTQPGGSSPGGYIAPSESMRPVAATEEDPEDGF